MKRWLSHILRLALVTGVATTLVACGAGGTTGGGGGSEATPTGGGGGAPVAVELPAIQMPTSVSANFGSGFSSDVVAPIGLLKSITDNSFLPDVVSHSISDAQFGIDSVNEILATFGGGKCARSAANSATSAATTRCTYTNSRGNVLKFDFSKVDSATSLFSFSHNGTNQSCVLDCVDNNTVAPDATHSLCMRVWLDGARYLIGKFNVVPVAADSTLGTSADSGAGCFIALRDMVLQVGEIYDNSNTLLAATSGPVTYNEAFLYHSPYALGDHEFVTQTGTSSTSYLLNVTETFKSGTSPNTLYNAMRYALDANYVYGNYKQGQQSTDSSTCTNKSGTIVTGCSATGSTNVQARDLTSPALGSYFDLAVPADYTLPSTTIFPSSPTF